MLTSGQSRALWAAVALQDAASAGLLGPQAADSAGDLLTPWRMRELSEVSAQ